MGLCFDGIWVIYGCYRVVDVEEDSFLFFLKENNSECKGGEARSQRCFVLMRKVC